MRRNWTSNRWIWLVFSLFLCGGLIFLSSAGVLAPLEGLTAAPLQWASGIINNLTLRLVSGVSDVAELQTLRQRNAELEEALAQFQSELVELREIASDYRRLSELLDYTTATTEQEFVTADVIAVDQSAFLRTIIINRGARDGIAIGMPVVTGQGLVGRVLQVSANAARVLLVTDQSSFVSARLQTSRAEGSVNGRLSGSLLMQFIALNAGVQEGDLVITSGLGGNFPPDIVIGQVVSSRQTNLYQEAEVRSLVSFDTLEFVLVITSFQPVDLSVFEAEPASPTTAGQ
ncbi:MAG: rod shape-determining protein MreC [Chloroflexi bacterium]|nr:rod shape-determining protein MreC [Chloroflexota bacterium]